MSVIDPYMMPEYYWVEESDLVSGMQMMNMMELNHTMPYQPYPVYPYGVEDHFNTHTQLNPTAPDFSPRQSEPSGEKKIIDRRVSKGHKYNNNCPMNVSPVSMDLVLAANYMLNDIFGFISPQLPLRQKPRYKDTKYPTSSKKNSSPKLPRSRSPSPCSVKLVMPEISYDKEELMELAKSPLCQVTPQAWPMIAKKMPRIVRREGPTANIIIKEVRAIKKQGETGIINNSVDTLEE